MKKKKAVKKNRPANAAANKKKAPVKNNQLSQNTAGGAEHVTAQAGNISAQAGATQNTAPNKLKSATKKKAKLQKKQKPQAAKKQSSQKPVAEKNNVMNRPTTPVSGEQKKAYNKAVRNRSKSARKRGSRGGNYILYYIFAAIIAVIVFSILAKTVLFNCASITVEGNQRYSVEEIIASSGLIIGESLLDINENAAENRIIASLAYIDMAEVTKSFPTRMKITVTEAEKWFCVQQDGRPYIISRMGKILEQASGGKLPAVVGYEAEEPTVGTYLKSAVEGKNKLPMTILTAAETAGIKDITEVDITDRFEIKVTVQDRIILQLGNSTELDNKMYIAKELIDTEISATESVTVNISNTEKVYVRDNNIIDNPDVVVPVLPENGTAEGTAESATQEAETSEAA